MEERQVPDLPFGHEVLGGEQAVMAGQVNLGSNRHRRPQQVHADPPGGRGRHLPGEEHPHMPAITGP